MFTSKEVNAVTKLVLNSGKLYLMSTELTLLVLIMVTLIFNLRELMYTIMKLLVVDMYQEPFLWILSQEPWTLSELDLSVNFLDQTTLFSDKLVQETTGPRVIILKVLNLLIQFLMLSEKNLKVVIASKVSK